MPRDTATTSSPLTDQAYADLLAFRTEMRRFMRWSEERAQDEAMTHMQHQLLLAVRAHDDPRGPTISEAADYLLMTLSTASELVDRAETGGYLRRRRSDPDGRVVRLSLTPAGRRKLERLTRLVLAELARLAPVLERVLADATRLEADRSGL
jgi:DNA-binding MarR family transcriptional regulator